MFDEFGINAGFVEEQYYRYLENPQLVEAGWRGYFARHDATEAVANGNGNGSALRAPSTISDTPIAENGHAPQGPPAGTNGGGAKGLGALYVVPARVPAPSVPPASGPISGLPMSMVPTAVFAQAQVTNLVNAYRQRGHVYADINPLQDPPAHKAELELSQFGLSEADLDRTFSAAGIAGQTALTLREIVGILDETYCRSIGVEFTQIDEPEIRSWLQSRMELTHNRLDLTLDEQLRVLTKLTDAEALEQFIHRTFVNAKRFSLEGAESLIPLLDQLIEHAAPQGVEEIVLGMAHRGRLNVLCNILGKNVRELFAAFDDKHPEWHFGSGDVKYHLGYSTDCRTASGERVHLTLAFNPSHLEFVNPVVEGRARAKQDRRRDTDGRRVMPLLVHGDAAFMGQGVVAETLNMAGLEGYRTGGTIHVIVNNQIGFTTEPCDGRSTRYASDLARFLRVPVFHVNGEDPESVAQVTRLATELRQKFAKDVVIDMYCYRKLGHNETETPSITLPLMYAKIAKLPSVREVYVRRLLEMGKVTEAQAAAIAESRQRHLMSALEDTRKNDFSKLPDAMGGLWQKYTGGPDATVPEVETAVPVEHLRALLHKISSAPLGFNMHKTVAAMLNKRVEAAEQGRGLEWGTGEALAIASLLAGGTTVRVSGQDSRRGTFSHRHAVLRDTLTGAAFTPLSTVAADGARFDVFDSPLSEAAVLGFDYGYSLDSPDALVCWEAQFGDFANSAQVIIDQFVVAAEDKWHRLSGLVLLLPHGFEGQGPEHSSARLERFLTMASEDNIQVCNLTTTAQIFHALRRQVLRPWRKPLVIMTPKSLLRKPEASSTLEELATGRFQRVIPDVGGRDPNSVERILLCSGKVYYDLAEARQRRKAENVAILRLEQLYPLNRELTDALAPYRPGTPLVWVQEEPWNMGPWYYLNARLADALDQRFPISCVSRPESASPATGSQAAHKVEQQLLVEQAFTSNVVARPH